MSRALDVLLSGRVILGEEAHSLGLVDRLVESDEVLNAAVDYATDLAENCSPWSMATMKRQLHTDLDSDAETAFAECDALMLASELRPDFAEGIKSFMERRPPDFPQLGPDD